MVQLTSVNSKSYTDVEYDKLAPRSGGLCGASMTNPALAARHRSAVSAILIAGTALRLWQFLADRSMWLDELAVARSIVSAELGPLLLDPLAFDQIAPPAFLAAAWLLHGVWPDADWPFRALPLAAALATLPLVYGLGRRVAGPGVGLGALAVVTFSPALISVGSITKQYSLDVFVTAVLLYGALWLTESNPRSPGQVLRVSLLGGVLLLFSFPGVLVAATLGAVVAAIWWLDSGWKAGSRIVALGVPLGLLAAATTGIALRVRSPDTSKYLDLYWAAGFPPNLLRTPLWLGRQLMGVAEAALLLWYPRPPSFPYLAAGIILFVVVGTVSLLRTAPRRAGLICAPLVAASAAAGAGLYPLAGRVSFFLAVPIAVLVTVAVVRASEWLIRQDVSSGLTRGAPLLAASVTIVPLALDPPPYGVEHLKPVLREVAASRLPSDEVWSYYGANPAVDFYGERLGLGPWKAGVCRRGTPREYLMDLDALRGHERVWIILTHALPVLEEREIILGYLRTIGVERVALDAQIDPVGTAAYLFDLSDSRRLARTSAASFDLSTQPEVDSRFGCGRGPLAPPGPRSVP